MATAYSKIYWYDIGTGLWVEEAPAGGIAGGFVEFTYTDTLYESAMLQILVADPNNVRLPTYETPYRMVMLKEKDTEAVLFVGRVTYCEPLFDQEYGQVIKVTCFDYLHELRDTWMRQKTQSVFPSDLVKDCVRCGSWTRLNYTGFTYGPLAPDHFSPGAWIVDTIAGANQGTYAQIVSNTVTAPGTGYLIIQSYAYDVVGAPADFTVGHVIYEVCGPSFPLYIVGWSPHATTAVLWRGLDVNGAWFESSDTALSMTPHFMGVGGMCLEEMGNYTKLDEWNTIPVGIGHAFMAAPIDIVGPEFEQRLYYFHRQKYLGLNAATLVLEAGGHDPCQPADHGLIVEFGADPPSGGDPVGPPPVPPDPKYGRWLNILPDYEFSPRYMGEIVTRVQYHYKGQDTSAEQQLVTDANTEVVENAYHIVREKHVFNFATANLVDAVELSGRVLKSLCTIDGVTRGRFGVAGYPMFWDVNPATYALENPRILRAGCMLYVLHTKIPSVNGVNMLVTEVAYHEPSGICRISVLDKTYGMEELKFEPGETSSEIQRTASIAQKQSSALAGLNNDDIAPVAPTQISVAHVSDPTAPCPVGVSVAGGISLQWDAFYDRNLKMGALLTGAPGGVTELDISHWELWRSINATAPGVAGGVAQIVCQTKATSFVDTTISMATDYYYWVIAVDTSRNRSLVSFGSGAVRKGAITDLFPVGYVFISTVAGNPGTVLGFGTWVALAKGRVLVGLDDAGTFSTPGATGGAETITLDATMIPAHTHSIGGDTGGESVHTHAAGSYAPVAEAAHTHAAGSYAPVAEAAHTHGISFTSGVGSNHSHTLSAHTHTGGAASTVMVDTTVPIEPVISATGTSGGPTPDYTNGEASHTHAVSGTSAAGSSHNHGFGGTSAAGSSHNHGFGGTSAAGSNHTHSLPANTGSIGGGVAHSNLQPYLVVYMWQRTA